MAHHQRHPMDYDSPSTHTLKTQPAASCSPTLPVASEDESAAEADEPPEKTPQVFTKTLPKPGPMRRTESLLTRAFLTDSESHDEDRKLKSIISHNPSVSSTCSNFSVPSAGDFTSDDGLTSLGTRASTPSSLRSAAAFSEQHEGAEKQIPRIRFSDPRGAETSQDRPSELKPKPDEDTVEAELGRRRCISFICGRTNSLSANTTKKVEELPATLPQPPKRTCSIKFLCPSKASAPKPAGNDGHPRTVRLHSPAPPPAKSMSLVNSKRGHRDSDTTIKNESSAPGSPVATRKQRRPSQSMNPARTEATRFHEFASSDDEVEDWIRESTCHRSRLTVTDTLQKENVIRQLAEEAEQEAIEEELDEDDEDDVDDTQTDFFSGEEDAGFQTDDEEGFAASDDDSDDDSDYEWWAPRRSPTLSPFIPSNMFRTSPHRNGSLSSLDDDSIGVSPKRSIGNASKRRPTRPVVIRSTTTELPDSTDFVCGTLDEDRPLEQAYVNHRKQREAAKHRPQPQDIDPTFPTSDPEVEKDDDEAITDEEDEVDDIPEYRGSVGDHHIIVHGRFDGDIDDARGRKHTLAHRRSPLASPRRLRSPPAPIKRGRSPAPRGMFTSSPKRLRSPPPPNQLTSPPPSRHGSEAGSPAGNAMAFLGTRNHELTHTASLPRSPHPFGRRRKSSNMTPSGRPPPAAAASDSDDNDSESSTGKAYTRSAIDIVQGLEQKRLKRREKLYKQYWKREEKKKHHRRPQPGKGAERMKQVGIECAVYRGKRILSV